GPAVAPGRRVVPAVAAAGEPTFRIVVRGGETAWRLAQWSEEPLDRFRARNRLSAHETLQAGRTVTVSAARVDRETFEARRAAFHEALRARAARDYPTAGTRPYVLKPGETPWRVAERHGIPYWLLEQANPDRDLAAAKAGDTLAVPVPAR
ncbi:MAG TPA: LysM domain-containing protein, partial [Thermodesulfobacteriota bacterium]|nr:LysM domain-containing protein [Thermodesulfobacteriota bacterium]